MGLINYVISEIARLIGGFLSVLPDTPFRSESFVSIATYAGYINYFVPIGRIVVVFGVWLGAIGVWYGIRWVLRVVRYID